MSLETITLLATVGLLGGAVNALAGGGSLIVFPVLLAVGLDPLSANVTNALAQWPGYVAMVAGTHRDLVGQAARVRLTAGAVVLGAAVGSILLLVVPGAVFDAVVPVLVIIASILMAVGPWVSRHVQARNDREPYRLLLPALFIAGVYGGYFGGALGVIIIAVLSVSLSDELRRLNALKGVLSVAASTVAGLAFLIGAPVEWHAVAVIAPASLVGGYVGGRLARRIPDRVLRPCVVLFGVCVGVYLAVT